MADAGTPQPDGPRPSTPRARGAGRDPAALAAWRRVAEQRKRAGSPAASAAPESPASEAPGSPAGQEPAADRSVVRRRADRRASEQPVEAPVPEQPVVEQPVVEKPVAEKAVAEKPVAEKAVAEKAVAGRPTAEPPAVVPKPAAERPAVERPAPARPVTEGTRPAVPTAADETRRPVTEAPVPARTARDEPIRPTPPAARTAPPVTRGEPAPAPESARPGLDDGPPDPGRLHDVLLGLAGRLDDDALTSVREMVAAEDDAEAAELLAGCLLAGGVGVTSGERAVLRPWFAAARVDAELLGLLPTDAGALDRSAHRFVATTTADRAPGVPLARAARRLRGVVAVRESWRVTPAGAAPGPVPHRVVLVETVGADDCDHVVHHLAHAARALDDTSVEVFASGVGLPAYHRAALAAARPLVVDDAPTPNAAVPVAPAVPVGRAPSVSRVGSAEDEETWQTVADSGAARPDPVLPVAVPQQVGDAEHDDEEPGLEDLDDVDEAEETDVAATAEVDDLEMPDDLQMPDDLDDASVVEEPEDVDEVEEAVVERRTPDPVRPPTPPAAPETSIDEDLSSTARRIAALWARPSPEDFSAPLPEDDSLEPTRLEPAGEPVAATNGRVHPEPAPEPPGEGEGEDEAPSGRHGRLPVADMGTTSFRSVRGRMRSNGRRVTRPEEPAAGRAEAPQAAEAAPAPEAPDDEAQDAESAQVLRARHSRAHDEAVLPEPAPGPARFGHDARFGAGPGPAWPGGPVTGENRPGPDTLFVSPVEVGEEPVALGTNGHRHGPAPIPEDEPDTLGTNGHRHDPVAADDDEPATGPVAWSGPAGPTAVAPPPQARPHLVGPPPPNGPRVVGPPPAAPGPRASGPPQPQADAPGEDGAPPWAPADATGWAPEPDDSVAQLSDRERELLARLHEELAQRERTEGADPFGPAGPQDRPAGRRPRAPGSPGGRVNGHGLPPVGPDDASA